MSRAIYIIYMCDNMEENAESFEGESQARDDRVTNRPDCAEFTRASRQLVQGFFDMLPSLQTLKKKEKTGFQTVNGASWSKEALVLIGSFSFCLVSDNVLH